MKWCDKVMKYDIFSAWEDITKADTKEIVSASVKEDVKKPVEDIIIDKQEKIEKPLENEPIEKPLESED